MKAAQKMLCDLCASVCEFLRKCRPVQEFADGSIDKMDRVDASISLAASLCSSNSETFRPI